MRDRGSQLQKGPKKPDIYQISSTFIGDKKWESINHSDCDAIRKFWEDNSVGRGANWSVGGGGGSSGVVK